MRWEDYRRSDNVVNRRGEGGSAFGGGGGGAMIGFMLLRVIFTRFGIGGVVVAVGAFFALSFLGLNPLTATGGGQGLGGSAGAPPSSAYDQEIAAVLASTEDVWNEQFAANGLGDYPEPRLNLFAGQVSTQGCGVASSAVGPFYCPGGRQIYIDTSFFDQLAQRFGAAGDFARAYVIAHEVGHHIQTVTGLSQQVSQQQARARSEAERNAYSVRLELMADCLAGVWARSADEAGDFLEEGDLQEGLRAANAIGDDALSGGRARPDSFTHGSSEQRQRWLSTGYQTGDMNACDTFSAGAL